MNNLNNQKLLIQQRKTKNKNLTKSIEYGTLKAFGFRWRELKVAGRK